MRGRTGRIAGLLVAGAALAACSTEPATEVTQSGATLNGTALTRAIAPSYVFELAATEADLGTARARLVPARLGASTGDATLVGGRVGGLSPDTGYVFRLCAVPPGGAARSCFGARTLTTLASHRISVCGYPSNGDEARDACTTAAVVENLATTSARPGVGGVHLDSPHEGYVEVVTSADAFGTGAARRSPARTVPAGVTSFTAAVSGLQPRTTYLHRTCLKDLEDQDVLCLDPGTFTTRYTTPAYVRHGGHLRVLGGEGARDGARLFNLDIDARAAADGGSATGSGLAFGAGIAGFDGASGPVTCLDVSGSRAVVGIGSAPFPGVTLAGRTFFVEDRGGAGADTVDSVGGRNADDCSPQLPGETTHRAVLDEGRATVEPAVEASSTATRGAL